MTDRKPTAGLIWTIHRTAPWWRCVGDRLRFDLASVLTGGQVVGFCVNILI